jgi:murein DD-endopeptidase MepM/ murein hydrolase activator NlpD
MKHEKIEKNRPAIALVLCFCAVALVSVMIVKANIDKIRDNLEGANVAEVIKEEPVETPKPEVVDSRDESSSDTDAIPQFIMPVEGEVITKYSVDELVYWETLDQYMTHSGLDIAAPKGTSVEACSAGTVTRIEEDDRFGMLVEIAHGNGLVSLYSNLSGDVSCEVGDVVACGDVIGTIGNTSMFEYDIDDHLHFEMMLNGESVDPVDYIG